MKRKMIDLLWKETRVVQLEEYIDYWAKNVARVRKGLKVAKLELRKAKAALGEATRERGGV